MTFARFNLAVTTIARTCVFSCVAHVVVNAATTLFAADPTATWP